MIKNFLGNRKLNEKHSDKINIRELLIFYDEDFISHLYKVILKRHPDNAGMMHYIKLLRSGVSRTEIIIQLYSSSEAKKIGIIIDGAMIAKIKLFSMKLPVIGQVLSFIVLLTRINSLIMDARALHNHVYRLSRSAPK